MKKRLPIALATAAFFLASCNPPKESNSSKPAKVQNEQSQEQQEEKGFVASCENPLFKVAPTYILKKTNELELEMQDSYEGEEESTIERIADVDAEIQAEEEGTVEESIEVINLDEIPNFDINVQFQNNQDDVELEKIYAYDGLNLDSGDKAEIANANLYQIFSEGEELSIIVNNAEEILEEKIEEIDFDNLKFKKVEAKDLKLENKFFIDEANVQAALAGTKLSDHTIQTEGFEIGLQIREECSGNVEEELEKAELEDDKERDQRIADLEAEREAEVARQAEIQKQQEAEAARQAEILEQQKAAAKAERERQEKINTELAKLRKTPQELLAEYKAAQAELKAQQLAAKKLREQQEKEKRIQEEALKRAAAKAEKNRRIELAAQQKAEALRKAELKLIEDAKVYKEPTLYSMMKQAYDISNGRMYAQEVKKHEQMTAIQAELRKAKNKQLAEDRKRKAAEKQAQRKAQQKADFNAFKAKVAKATEAREEREEIARRAEQILADKKLQEKLAEQRANQKAQLAAKKAQKEKAAAEEKKAQEEEQRIIEQLIKQQEEAIAEKRKQLEAEIK